MRNKLNIFFLSTEVAPFASTNDSARRVSEFAKALKELEHDIRVMMPNYKCVNERKYVLRDVIRLKDMPIHVNGKEVKVSAKSAFLPNSKVQIYFLDHKGFFGRDGLYADPKTGKMFPDNAERFVAFCNGCFETLRMLHWQPDIIHCNGWPTGIIPLTLRTVLKSDKFFQNAKLVFELNEISDQTNVSADALAKSGIQASELESGGQLNLLQAAVEYSDLLITPSQNFVEEHMPGSKVAPKLEKVIIANAKKIVGIPAGIDAKEWDPEVDQHLAQGFSAKAPSRKEANKKALLQELGMPVEQGAPLVLVPSPFSDTETASFLDEIAPDLMKLGYQLLMLGKASAALEAKLRALAKAAPARIAWLDNPEASNEHQAMAAADVFYLPAAPGATETRHLIGMRYGAIPVLLPTGSVAETVSDYNSGAETATGFFIAKSQRAAIVAAFQKALEVYKDAKKWQRLVRNALKADYSWEASAASYARHCARLVGLKK